MGERGYDAVVIGAGMAGLTAGRALAEAGLRIAVLEARDRVGGRILTRHEFGEAVELGAEFIHGRPAELWALVDEVGLETYERDGAQVCYEGGTLVECSDEIDHAFDPLEKLKEFTGPDLSFAEYLSRQQMPEEAHSRMIGYVEGFNAADYREISAAALGAQQKAEDAIGSDHNYSVRGGYDQLPRYLAGRIAGLGGSIRTGTPVRSIRWVPGEVTIDTEFETISAPKCIVTLPLGVLQAERVSILPAPTAILEAATKLRMGQVRRFSLVFRERFWNMLQPQPALKELSFLFAFSELPPVWWTHHPDDSHMMTGWVGGPRSAALFGLSSNELGIRACATLAKIFGLEYEQVSAGLRGCSMHAWEQDPYALGSYSYVATGGLGASKAMTKPVEGTLFFAGEHTDVTAHWGTVHAAMRSGLRAAAQVLGGQS